MNCYYHPDREPVGMCVSCGRLVCAECKVELQGKIHCNQCAEQLLRGSPKPYKPYEFEGLNWFQRHLNWTWFLFAVVGTFLLSFVIGLIVGLTDPYARYISDETLYWLIYLIGIAVELILGAWVLRRKARSLWWLLILFIPFGWIVFLCLDNRRELIWGK
jgi:type III secretory pathway component EscS